MLIYLAGKYSGDIDGNIAAARKIAVQLWEDGYYVICPHLNTAHFETDCEVDYETYLRGDFAIIERVDAVVLLPGWKDSKGAVREREHAQKHSVPVFEYPALPPSETARESALQKAQRIIHGARQQAYGHPRDDFRRTAGLWTALLAGLLKSGARITPEHVALMMILVKVSRLIATPGHRDSVVDVAGYAGTYEMLYAEEEG